MFSGNAMKYTMAGFVKVSFACQGSDAVFSVQDSGVGVPGMSRVFSPTRLS